MYITAWGMKLILVEEMARATPSSVEEASPGLLPISRQVFTYPAGRIGRHYAVTQE